MSIKKSSLEQKWYYRVAKVIFLWVPPILVAVAALLLIAIDMSGTGADIITAIQNDSTSLFYMLVGSMLYILILKGIWRGFLYIAFGGLEDDTKKKVVETAIAQPASSPGTSTLTPADKNQIVGWVLTLIAIGAIYYAYFIYESPPPIRIYNNGDETTSACISTGCGSNWYCNGSYYSDGVKKRVNGCYSSKTQVSTLPSWYGDCRQCP